MVIVCAICDHEAPCPHYPGPGLSLPVFTSGVNRYSHAMSMPDRIWADPSSDTCGGSDYSGGEWVAPPPLGAFGETEYVRADLFAALLKQIDDCAMYLKPGETPRQRMDRDFGDVQALLQLLVKEKQKNEEKL